MKVSVCMITYNHEKYIIKAVKSILDQKTNFDFELIIANDNSLDQTNNLIIETFSNEIKSKKIKYIQNPKNVGMMPNFINTIKICKGDYIALCEGDDYWTNYSKLQQQVDFLDKNKDYSICYHKVNININEVIEEDKITFKVPQKTTIYDLAKGNYIHTCSVVYRNHLFEKFPEYFHKAPVGDYFLHMLNSRYGPIFCIDEKMAIYRVHETSYWSSKKQEDRTLIWIDFIDKIKVNFQPEIQALLESQKIKLKQNILKKKKVSLFKRIKLYIKKIIKEFSYV